MSPLVFNFLRQEFRTLKNSLLASARENSLQVNWARLFFVKMTQKQTRPISRAISTRHDSYFSKCETPIRILVPLVLSNFLSACVSLHVPTTSTKYTVQTPLARQAQLANVRAWQTQGALSVRYNHKADIANYVWDQSANGDYQIKISSALNLYQLQLVGRGRLVSLQQNDGKIMTAKTPEALLQKTVGWYLPISPLSYWYKGMPAPVNGTTDFQAVYDRYGHLVSLSQAGWQLHFESYQRVAEVDLPEEMTIQRPGLLIKIVTKQWRIK